MLSPRFLFIVILFLLKSQIQAQNISGTINSYASVSNITGANITVSSGLSFSAGNKILLVQMKGASVNTLNASTFGNINSMGGAGTFEFLTVSGVSGNMLSTTAAPSNTYNVTSGLVQVVLVPKYCQPVVTGTLSCLPWDPVTGKGGVLALEAGTLTLNGNISADAAGFTGGNFATSSFCCSNGNFAGTAGTTGGQKGESISAYITGLDGLKGKQANGGGAGNCGNSGGGGGGNSGAGGFGGNQYSGCGVFDDRGIGALPLLQSQSALFLGGGGGGGFRDNGQIATKGGNGGGIIYIKANVIICNLGTISSNGENVSTIANDEGSGGGGAGGSIFIECNTYTGNFIITTNGGFGGSNYNSFFPTNCHGTGGGGAGGVFAFSPSALPVNISYSSIGGLPGIVNNPSSTCYNTANGATAGFNGGQIANLPAVLQSFNTPTVTVVQSNTICVGQSATLTATGATTYSWSTGAVVAAITVTPPVTTQYTVTGVSGSCAAGLVHTVVVSPGPTLTVTGTPTICSGQTATVNASGAVSYAWSNSATTNSITVTPILTTVYTVTGTTTGCTATQSFTVGVTTTPTVAITGTPTVCNGQTVTLTAFSANSYNWSNGSASNAISVSPSANTTYSVKGSNGSCTVAAFHSISVSPVPTLNITGPSTLCTGSSANISVTGAGSYTWSTGSNATSIVINPFAAGPVIYTVTGVTGGCAKSLTHLVTAISMPTLNIQGSSTACYGQAITLTALSATSYLWNTGATTSAITVTPLIPTTYSLVAANGACSVSAGWPVNVNPTPTIVVTASNPTICTGSSSQLFLSGASSYSWSTGPATSVLTVTPFSTTTYTVYGSLNNCTSSGIVTISVTATPVLYAPQNHSLCVGINQATLTAGGAVSFVWSPAVGLSSTTGPIVIANPTTTTIYTVQGNNGACFATSTVAVVAYTVPQISISASTDFLCRGYPVTLTAYGGNLYSWNPSNGLVNNTANAITVIPPSTTVYTLTCAGGNNCVAMATQTITVLDVPQIITEPSFAICPGGTQNLPLSGADYYSWSPTNFLTPVSYSEAVVAPPTTQVYTVTGYNGQPPRQCFAQTTVVVNVYPYAKIKITKPDSVCLGNSIYLSATGAKDYSWTPSTFLSNNLISNPALTPTTSMIYTVTGIGSGSCAGTQTTQVIVKPVPYVTAGRDTSINFDEAVMLSGWGEGSLYTWKGDDLSGLNCVNCPQTYVYPKSTTCYVLEVRNSFGCTASDQVCVAVTYDYGVYIPGSFTPNGDGLNDVFMPYGFGVGESELLIYNRWGQKMFEGTGNFTEGNFVSWDGSYKGERCKSDSYTYKFIYTLRGTKQVIKDGSVILLDPQD